MKSILQDDENVCYLCGMNSNVEPLEWHHVFGGKNRSKSDEYGLTVRLHATRCHNFGKNSVHINAEVRKKLQAEVQRKAMEYYEWTVEKFIEIFGRNYL